MSAAIKKEYRANNGEEMIQAILKEFELALRGLNKFPLHLAFHNWEFVGGIKLKAHHMKQSVNVKFSGKDLEIDENVSPETHELDEITVQVEHLPQPPDKVRELIAETPILTIKEVEKVLSDKMDAALSRIMPPDELATETVEAYREVETQPESQQTAETDHLGDLKDSYTPEPEVERDALGRRKRRPPLSGWNKDGESA